MKTTFAAALALLVGGTVGCGWFDSDDDRETRDRDVRDEQPMSQGGDRDAWTRMHSDPVCGHTVNPKSAIKEVYGTETYFFHNEECAEKFRENPHAYLPDGDDRDLDGDGYPDRRRRDREVK